MIYDFTHYLTIAGRTVRFAIDGAELSRALEAAPAELGDAIIARHELPGESVDITMPAAAARELADTLASIGGDAAVAARMLRAHIEGMVAELRKARTVGESARNTGAATDHVQRLAAGAA